MSKPDPTTHNSHYTTTKPFGCNTFRCFGVVFLKILHCLLETLHNTTTRLFCKQMMHFISERCTNVNSMLRICK